MTINALLTRWPQPWFIVTTVALVSCATSQQGSDLSNYQVMSEAVQTADLEVLDSEFRGVELRAVTGLPYRHWSFGPPLFIAIFESVVRRLDAPINPEQLIAVVCVTTFWFMVFMGLEKISNPLMASLGVAIAFVATPLGFYSCYNAMEMMTLFPAGVLFFEACKAMAGERANSLVVGTAAGMLMMFRPYLGAYAWSAMAIALYDSMKSPSPRYAIMKDLACFALPVSLALWQIGTVHWWMTGDPLKSPYSFGDEQFRSFDARSPYFLRVLFSPYHGAFAYSPLVGFGTFLNSVLVWRAIKRRRLKDALFWGLSLAAVICNYYFAGCWYIWWMCGWFGNRNIYIAGLIATAATITVMQQSSGKMRLLISGITVGSTAWTFLLLQRGAQSYCDFTTMFAGLEHDLDYWMDLERVAVLVFSTFVASLIALKLSGCAIARSLTAVVCTLVFVFLADRVLIISPPTLIMTTTVLLAVLAGFASHLERLFVYARFFVPACFALMVVSFLQLDIETRPKMRYNPSGLRFPEYDMIYNIDMVKGIPCIAGERHEMLEFLRRTKGEDWFLQYMEEDQTRESGRPIGGVRNYKEILRYRYL